MTTTYTLDVSRMDYQQFGCEDSIEMHVTRFASQKHAESGDFLACVYRKPDRPDAPDAAKIYSAGRAVPAQDRLSAPEVITRRITERQDLGGGWARYILAPEVHTAYIAPPVRAREYAALVEGRKTFAHSARDNFIFSPSPGDTLTVRGPNEGQSFPARITHVENFQGHVLMSLADLARGEDTV